MPTLRNLEQAHIDRAKIEDYLLNRSHPQGRSKAMFFERFGFSRGRWTELATAILEQAARYDAVTLPANEYGQKFVVEGPIATPSGRSPGVRSIWFVANGSESPVFVTAFPGQELTP